MGNAAITGVRNNLQRKPHTVDGRSGNSLPSDLALIFMSSSPTLQSSSRVVLTSGQKQLCGLSIVDCRLSVRGWGAHPRPPSTPSSVGCWFITFALSSAAVSILWRMFYQQAEHARCLCKFTNRRGNDRPNADERDSADGSKLDH